jgi:uncharacterized protein YqhQ
MPKGEYLQYGGQAIIEGVMMRSPKFISVACRAPNGEIVDVTEPIEATWIGRQKWLKLPFLRGSLGILDALVLGNRALRFSANVQMDEKYQPKLEGDDPRPAEETKKPVENKKLQDATVVGAVVVGLALGIALFNLLPNLISAAFNSKVGVKADWRINLTTEIVKVVFFIGYIWLIGQMKEVKRIFQYHGAEHKAINAMEAEQELSRQNCLAQTRLHPRCGTSFAIVVLIVSILLFTFIPRPPGPNAIVVGLLRFLMELPLLPVVAGISYELIRFAGKFRSQSFVMALFWPGLMTQYLTTREPDPDQVDVAIRALENVLEAERTAATA